MTKQKIDSLIKERTELINTMYDCSDKLLAALQTGDLINAERYDYIREGCWDQIKYIDENINKRLKESNRPLTFKERALSEMWSALCKLTKTSRLVLSSALKIRDQVLQTTNRSKRAKKTSESQRAIPLSQDL